ncbi:hypothetical protein TruAng_011283 [Truncatella angustata]|nr:hypothetical protein TruAng_011283 [Truncatella angustata]
MSAQYDVPTYLLDKENIRDTVIRMMFAFDQRATLVLVNRVYTPEIILDYDTLLIGKGIENIASSEWAKRLETMHDHFDTTQHIVQNLLVELPQPGSAPRPARCTVFAYAHGWFYKRDGEGWPRTLGKRNGANYELELVRSDDEKAKGGNPWRITRQKDAK